MRIILLLTLTICLTGCVRKEVKNNIRDKHAVLYVYVKRINNPDVNKRPSPSENEEIIKAMLKDYESLDKVLNNWRPSVTIPEVDLDGKPASVDKDLKF